MEIDHKSSTASFSPPEKEQNSFGCAHEVAGLYLEALDKRTHL